jgi:E3 ubiquitin-protein ligase NEDD4
MGGVKDIRLASPIRSPRDLDTELRSSSTPNLASLGRESPLQQPLTQQHVRHPQQQQQQSVTLPQGWEEKYDAVNKRVFYVDHNTKTTTWTRPATAPSPTAADVQQQQQEGSPASTSAGSSASGQQLAGVSGSGSLARKSRPGSSGKGMGEDGADDSDSGVLLGPFVHAKLHHPFYAPRV